MRAFARQIVKLDVASFHRVSRSHSVPLDRALPRLSRAANHSVLWIVVAALLTSLGGRRGRRAAIRGLASTAATSLLVNQLLKQIVRRPRPPFRHVPVARRLAVQPLTTSFPSGHAASAAAFAVGVASEAPRAGAPVGVLAALVAYSRTYVGVHYPLDVVVGAAIGSGFGLLSRLLWPVFPLAAEAAPASREAVHLPPSPDGDGVALVLNVDAGGAGGPDADELRRRLPRARIRVVENPSDLAAALSQAANECQVLGIAGGDGSVSTAAMTALEHDKPLLVIPTGTLNHLGRDLRVESAQDALSTLADGQALRVDVGLIDGRPFVNTASFGGYTAMLDIRERLQKQIGRWPAHLVAVALAALRTTPLKLELDGRRLAVWMVFVGNCLHEPAGFAPSWRPRLDDGLLDVRILRADRPLARLRLLASLLTGRLTSSVAYERHSTDRLDVRTGLESLALARDGDAFDGSGDFELRKLPRSLVIYAPGPGG